MAYLGDGRASAGRVVRLCIAHGRWKRRAAEGGGERLWRKMGTVAVWNDEEEDECGEVVSASASGEWRDDKWRVAWTRFKKENGNTICLDMFRYVLDGCTLPRTRSKRPQNPLLVLLVAGHPPP